MLGMGARRYLCSQLVRLRVGETTPGETTLTANLEEIHERGAVLECEQPLPEGARAELTCAGATLHGVMTSVEPHEFGWRVSIEFSPLTPWSRGLFEPEHLLDLDDLGPV
jgi:hypothetical protein